MTLASSYERRGSEPDGEAGRGRIVQQPGRRLLREDSDGNLIAQLQNTTTLGNTGDGLEFDENSARDLDVIVKQATSSNNVLAGIRADHASPGSGALQLVTFTATGNGAGAIVANAGVTVTQTP